MIVHHASPFVSGSSCSVLHRSILVSGDETPMNFLSGASWASRAATLWGDREERRWERYVAPKQQADSLGSVFASPASWAPLRSPELGS